MRTGCLATLSLTACFAVPATACAASAPACSVDTFTIAGVKGPVTVTLCPSPRKAGAGKTATVAVVETIDGKGTSFERQVELDFFDNETTSRSIDDVPLEAIGLPKTTLHLTIGYRAGTVRLEHALLVPGAVALK